MKLRNEGTAKKTTIMAKMGRRMIKTAGLRRGEGRRRRYMEVDGGGDGQKDGESPSPSMGLACLGLALERECVKLS